MSTDTDRPMKKRKMHQTTLPSFVEAPPRLKRVISGGQRGADLAALEAARNTGFETGGIVPAHFPAELTRTYADFGMQSLVAGDGSAFEAKRCLIMRSKRNVDESDATIAFRAWSGDLRKSPGTNKTIGYCETGKWQLPTGRKSARVVHKPCLVLDCTDTDKEVEERAVDDVLSFILEHNPKTLNVAGSREDLESHPHFSATVRRIMQAAFTSIATRQRIKNSTVST